MEKRIILTKTTQSGKTVTVYGQDYCGRPSVSAIIDGKYYSSYCRLAKPQTVGPVVVVAAIERVIGITEPEAQIIETAITQIQAEIDATPEARMAKLMAERRRIADRMAGALDAKQYEIDKNFELECCPNPFANAAKWDAEYDAAKADLDAFDLAHPEVPAEIKRRMDERVASNMWN